MKKKLKINPASYFLIDNKLRIYMRTINPITETQPDLPKIAYYQSDVTQLSKTKPPMNKKSSIQIQWNSLILP